MRYALIKTLREHYPISVMSRVFDVTKSGYYAWLKRGPSPRAKDNTRLAVAIQAAHVRTRQSYGPARLRDELAAEGFHAGVGRIKRMLLSPPKPVQIQDETQADRVTLRETRPGLGRETPS